MSWPALRSDSGIDNHNMQRVRREVRGRLDDGERAIKYIKRIDRIADINDLCLRIDVEDHALHGADKMIVESKVRSEGNESVGQEAILRELG